MTKPEILYARRLWEGLVPLMAFLTAAKEGGKDSHGNENPQASLRLQGASVELAVAAKWAEENRPNK